MFAKVIGNKGKTVVVGIGWQVSGFRDDVGIGGLSCIDPEKAAVGTSP